MELKKRALGKGLSALIPDSYMNILSTEKTNEPPETARSSSIEDVRISEIHPNHRQPRQHFPEETIRELADSIREQGILQPVVVKKAKSGYELICGERRMRAAQFLGLEKIPAVVKDVAEEKLIEWALVENIQREDLNAVEEGQAYLKLVEENGFSQDEVARKVGKDRSTVANTIRLLRLPEEVLTALLNGDIQAGHARAILSLPTPEHQRQMARRIVKEKLSVRQVEEIVGRVGTRKRRAKQARLLDQEILALEAKLERVLGTQVRIFPNKNNQGRVEIRYYSLDDLDRVLNLLGISPA